MICFCCPHYESSGMSTGEAWNRCGITEAEYFRTEDTNCPYVDENGNDNGKFDELMREYEESHGQSNEEKATYLLPIWIDIYCHGDPKDILIDLNEKLTEFFEKYVDAVAMNLNSIDIQWSVNQHVNLNG